MCLHNIKCAYFFLLIIQGVLKVSIHRDIKMSPKNIPIRLWDIWLEHGSENLQADPVAALPEERIIVY